MSWVDIIEHIETIDANLAPAFTFFRNAWFRSSFAVGRSAGSIVVHYS